MRIGIHKENMTSKSNKIFSMQFRFLAIVIFAMFAISIFVGGLSIYKVDSYVQEQAENFVKVTCENEGAQINDSFGDMEKSVKIMESYVMDFFENKADTEDFDLLEKIIENADEMFTDVAKHTNGAVAYYLRFNPDISDSKSGLFYSKVNGSDEYTALEPTDISRYDKNDTEHVGWFWQPYEAGKPVWMAPYYNQNNNILMISYVIPMYFEEKFVGVVGMDFDYTVLASRVHEIEVYENGFAHLELDGVTIHSKNGYYDDSYKIDSENYLQVYNELTNGMTLVISADYNDIRQIRYEIAVDILIIVLVLSVLFTIIVVIVVKRTVDPLKKLTEASVQLAEGNYDVDIVHSDTHEIKLLSSAFENMAKKLCEREELLRVSANRDSLTGLRNTTSYKAWLAEFSNQIEKRNLDFGVVVLDLNFLKETNDFYGHDVGNDLIIASAKIISESFKRSPAFRIGGDEFLVILQNTDLEEYQDRFKQFDLRCENTYLNVENQKIPIRIARGFARFDPNTDTCYLDVFRRADDAMYKHKRKMKIS